MRVEPTARTPRTPNQLEHRRRYHDKQQQSTVGSSYTFNFLPQQDTDIPTAPSTPARRSAYPADVLPARLTPAKVNTAIMSFADFLHFLEEHRQEYKHMPEIITRVSELGAVMESQKRHIDRWKEKELDLAISEAQQGLELISDLGNTIQQQELQLAAWQEEKQSWEEKFELATQEIELVKSQANLQIQQLNEQLVTAKRVNEELQTTVSQQASQLSTWQSEKQSWIEKYESASHHAQATQREAEQQIQQLKTRVEELHHANVDLESVVTERGSLMESMEADNDKLQALMEKIETERANLLQEKRAWASHGSKQSETLSSYEQQLTGMRQMCDEQRKQAEALAEELATWKERSREKETHMMDLKEALKHAQNNNEAGTSTLEQMTEEGSRLQSELEARTAEYERKFASQQQQLLALNAEKQDMMQRMQQETERYNQHLEEMNARTENDVLSALQEMQDKFSQEKQRLEAEWQLETQRFNHETAELQAKIETLKEANSQKTAEVGRLMANHQELANRPNEADIEQLIAELDHFKSLSEQLTKDLMEKDRLHDEDIKDQMADFETQYTAFVTQVEEQQSELTEQNNQLRVELNEEKQKQMQQLQQAAASKQEEISKMIVEREQLKGKINAMEREGNSISRELDHRKQELEMKKKEADDLRNQIERFLSPDNEQSKQVDILQQERVRLEEENREIVRQMEALRKEANEKLDEASRVHMQSLEQEAAHRMEVHALQSERQELNRKVMGLTNEKSTLEFQITKLATEKNELGEAVNRLNKEKRELEARMQDLMRQANEKLGAQHQNATLVNEEVRTQLQNVTSQLLQREEQLTQGGQQLRACQESINSLETKNRQLQHELETAEGWNAQLKLQLESLDREKRLLDNVQQRENASTMQATKRLEEMMMEYNLLKQDTAIRIQEKENEVTKMKSALDIKTSTHDMQLRDQIRELQQSNRSLEQELEEMATNFEALKSDLEYADSQTQMLEEVQRDVETLEKEKASLTTELDEMRSFEQAHEELKSMHEQFKKDIMKQLSEKSQLLTQAEDDYLELQSKLDREKEMTRHLMGEVRAEKADLTGKSKDESISDIPVQDLEKKVQQLERKIQVDEEIQVAKDQSVLHEKMQKERELRTLQSQHERLTDENASLQKELATKSQEVEEWEQMMKEHSADMERARYDMDNAAREMTLKLEQLEDELQQTHHELAEKTEEVSKLADDHRRAQKQLETQRNEVNRELEKMKQENEAFRFLEQRNTLRSELQDSSLQSKLDALQTKYDLSMVKQERLVKQVESLKNEAIETNDFFMQEVDRRKLVLAAFSDGGKNTLQSGLSELLQLVQSYQDREVRQDSLIHRKEQQVTELKELLKNALQKQKHIQQKYDQEVAANDVQKQIDAMSEEVSNLMLENRQLLVANDSVAETIKSAYEEKLASLKVRIRALREENSSLKQHHVSNSSESKRLMKEVTKLKAQVAEQESELQALRKADSSRLRNSSKYGNSSSGSQSRRIQDLLLTVQQKEEKIMVLNDHLTEQMTRSIQLQHENERYIVRYGALPGSSASVGGVIGNSGIHEPSHYVRSQ